MATVSKWDITDIYLYFNGECKAGEFIEDDSIKFSNDGTVHYIEFIEGNASIKLSPTALYASEFLERIVAYLMDESDVYLTDESGDCLTTII